MQEKLLKQARHEYRPKERMIALLFLAPIFLALLPAALILLGRAIDQWVGWSPILAGPLNLIFGGLLTALGVMFGVWSIYSQFTIGRGTPVPLMATQKLVVQPPYTYCRNPMALGAILMYLGPAILFGSIGAIILLLLGAVCLLTYIRLIEEREMELRFGEEYLAYKNRTPFLVPRFRK